MGQPVSLVVRQTASLTGSDVCRVSFDELSQRRPVLTSGGAVTWSFQRRLPHQGHRPENHPWTGIATSSSLGPTDTPRFWYAAWYIFRACLTGACRTSLHVRRTCRSHCVFSLDFFVVRCFGTSLRSSFLLVGIFSFSTQPCIVSWCR